MSSKNVKQKLVDHIKDFKQIIFKENDGQYYINNGSRLYIYDTENHPQGNVGDEPIPILHELRLAVGNGEISFEEIKNIHNTLAPRCVDGLVFLDAIINDNWEIYNKLYTIDGLEGWFLGDSMLYQRLIKRHFEDIVMQDEMDIEHAKI